LQDIFSKVDKSGEGVCVQASTLGSLEALLSFLDSPEVSLLLSFVCELFVKCALAAESTQGSAVC
jgi:translation initiation factor IF-2